MAKQIAGKSKKTVKVITDAPEPPKVTTMPSPVTTSHPDKVAVRLPSDV